MCPSAARITSISEIVANTERGELPGLVEELARGLVTALIRSAAPAVATADPAPSEVSNELLTVDEAAARIGMKKTWLYRHGGKLPFARKLGHRSLRFDARGLERWLKERRTA